MSSSCGGDEDRCSLWHGRTYLRLLTKTALVSCILTAPSLHINECSVLPLHYTILLWSVGSGELMLDAFLLKIFLYLKILKL
jgi:hypothetical protein